MADFVAHIGANNADETFSKLESLALNKLGYSDLSAQKQDGCRLLLMEGHSQLQFYNGESGWIVVKGIIYGSDSNFKHTPESILNIILNNTDTLNRFEGAFCLVAWDKQRKVGFGLNDQSGMLNLYFLESYGGVFIASNALLLAKAVGLGLSPQGVAEFLARGALLAPRTMFNGLSRLNVGEHLEFGAGRSIIRRHWYAFADRMMKPHEVVERLSETIVKSISRLAEDHQPVVCDLTGGYDSRLVVASALKARLPISVTVNGPPTAPDVVIAHAVAHDAELDILHFDPAKFSDGDIDEKLRRDLIWRTSGELRFTEIYYNYFWRPLLAQTYSLHTIGIGGEFLRYHPWGQEFFGIGRRRLANVDRAMAYRFLHSPVPQNLAPGEWWPWYRNRLSKDIQAVCKEVSGTHTTEQLEAMHVWKMTSHSTLYLTSLFNWLPTVAPMLTASVVKDCVSIPWEMKLTTALQRKMIKQLSPKVAKSRTAYGATAEPPTFRTLHLEALQSAKRALHFVKKIEKVVFRGACSRRWGQVPTLERVYPFWSDDFGELLDPKRMKSRALYSSEHLIKLTEAKPTSGPGANQLLALATIEELCQELGVELDGQFFKNIPD